MHGLLGQIGRFFGVGIIAAIIQYSILIILVHFGMASSPTASSIGYAVSAVFNYYLNYTYTFRSSQNHLIAIIRFCVVAGLGFILNYAAMVVAVEALSIHYLISQIMATGLVIVWSFSANRLWTYKTSVNSSGFK